MPFTAGSRTIEFMGRFGRVPLHFQHPCCLGKLGRAMSTQTKCVLRVCRENVHTVYPVLLIFKLRFPHEPLEDVILVRNDTIHNQRKR